MRIALGLLLALVSTTATAQQFKPGPPLTTTTNVKVFGGVVSAESCVYDAKRGLILAINRGAAQKEAPNDAFVTLLNHDGSVHTPKWIGETRDGLTLNQPFGSDIANGALYLADSDGDTADGAPRTAVIRSFDLATGAPGKSFPVQQSPWLNDLAVAADGTIYASQTVAPYRIYRIAPDGSVSTFLEGAPLGLPNGVAIDGKGNIVVVNVADDAVLTFSPAGKLLTTEHAAQAGSDGLVIMADGTKYVSSVRNGGISRIRPGKPAELIATGIPSAASMCLDSGANQLVIPMNANNGLAFIKLK